DRVHVGRWLKSESFRLGRLTTSDFLSPKSDKAVKGHVLGFERSDTQALFLKPTAKSGRQHALAGVRAGALDHQRFGHRTLSYISALLFKIDRSATTNCSFSFLVRTASRMYSPSKPTNWLVARRMEMPRRRSSYFNISAVIP